jgi:hypothetical protein
MENAMNLEIEAYHNKLDEGDQANDPVTTSERTY